MYYKICLALVPLLLLISGCKKDKDCLAGSGGNHTLVLKPQHHGDPIYNQPNYPDSAMIKFGAGEFPGDDASRYDIVIAGQPGTDQVTVSGLQCGNYYIFMTGFDTTISQRVKGGIPYQITENAGNSLTLVIPVTED